ncbi:MAG: rhamnulokinase family protein [Ruthenibacterium sp.]
MKTTVLAFDFGASGGRAIKAVFEDGTLRYEEVHRFENVPIRQGGQLRWNLAMLMENVALGIQRAGLFDSIGFDAWGIDFGLLGEDGKLLQNPVHYRDARTKGLRAQACTKIPASRLYAETGNQIMDMNTLFQLMASDLSHAKTLLFMPDLFAYLLCGKAVCEETVASTGQLLSPRTRTWSKKTLQTFGIPETLFAPLVKSGTVLGEYAGSKAKIIATAGHDTQCAVAAMPVCPEQAESAAFLSCGTWSLLGTELDAPILTEKSNRLALSNELGANGKINYLKNIVGLWLIQESRRAWRSKGREYSYAELEQCAREAPALRYFIDPDAPEFAQPGDIPALVRAFCEKTGQGTPNTVGEIVRCLYESLALKYRFALEQIRAITQKKFSVLHILGGGTKDALLCQMTANSCKLPVLAGPVEATALGNVIVQLVALGALPDIAAGRAILRKTEAVRTYTPCETPAWDAAFEAFKALLQSL